MDGLIARCCTARITQKFRRMAWSTVKFIHSFKNYLSAYYRSEMLPGIVFLWWCSSFSIFSSRYYLHPSQYVGKLNFTHFSIGLLCTLDSATGINEQEDENVEREYNQETYFLAFFQMHFSLSELHPSTLVDVPLLRHSLRRSPLPSPQPQDRIGSPYR